MRFFGMTAVAAALLLACSVPTTATPPRYDHIVCVIEENHSAQQVMGSPFFASLAARGAFFSHAYAVTHPSQPNYIALFSGSTQGVTDDNLHDITAPNLATSLLSAGLSFAGYSEGLPSAGYRGFTSGRYVRKHNPWASFTNAPDAVNLPFTDFPGADYTLLPTVSIVVPNLDNDMHDGSVAAGDAWLQNNLDGFVRWAVDHNSLFIVTFDECAGTDPVAMTPIATILVGARVRQGTYDSPITLYSILRMLEDAYNLPYLGEEKSAPGISGIWE